MMESSYAKAIAWADRNYDTRMKERFQVGLESHRLWMREGR